MLIMFKLILIYLAIFVNINNAFNSRNDSRVISDSETRERVINSENPRNDVTIRRDILDSIAERIDDRINDSPKRQRQSTRSSEQKKSASAPKKPKSVAKRVSKSTEFRCGGDVTLHISHEITTPLYPSKYPPNLECKWNITAQSGQTIKIEIFRLNIENDDNCKFDYLDIKGVRRLCGKVSDSVIPINSSSVELMFRSDANNENLGFHLRLITESRDCVRELNVTNYSYITSPKYPGNYDDSTDCWTLIRTEVPNTLVLTFEVLLLEHDSQCAYDYLEVFDSSDAINSLGKLCEKPENVTLSLQSSRSALLLHFHSDQLLNNKGFRAEVSTSQYSSGRVGCKWKVNWTNMTLNSPNYPSNYPPNLNCEISLSAPSKDERIVILFDWIHLEAGAKCGNNDRLEIYEDEKVPKRVICGRFAQPFKYVSKIRTIKIKFISDGFAEFPGFMARLTYLNVNRAEPRIGSKLMRSPQNASVILGSTHVLHCEPLTNDVITWFIGDKQITTGISSDGRSLIIREFTIRSEGRYICKFGSDYRDAWLTTKRTNCPTVTFRKRPKDMSVSEGDFIVLECNVVDAKYPVRWERDGRPLQIANNSRVNQLHNGYLLLDPAKTEDSGIYFCTTNANSECTVRSGARVSVNQRVNILNVCGLSHTLPPTGDISKIIGGTDAIKSSFPWHVMFWDYRRKSFCGGALLNERWVVTAAHCFESGIESAIEVKLGKYDQTVSEESEIVTKIAEVIRHPDFSRETFDNDISLVRLSQHISFTPHVIPICLSDKRERRQFDEYFLKPNSALRIGHVTGWGQLKENGPQPRYLQELRVPIVEEAKCRASTAFKVTTNMFCAGYGKEVLGDACKGDSGGPFVVPYKSRWVMLGVVSWGEGCGRTGKFGFYTRINNYLDWINAIIKL